MNVFHRAIALQHMSFEPKSIAVCLQVLMDCDLESPAEWAPYENYVEQLLYLPNGTRSPSRLHEKQYSDWQYVLRLKAG